MPDQIPEPPDGARVEWDHHTDRYAAWRDDTASAQAGYIAGDGGEVWCLYGQSVPVTWARLCDVFGESLRDARRLHTETELRAAVDRAQLRVVGEHIVEPGGWCRRCDVRHSGPEIARLEDRLEQEMGGEAS